MKINSIDKFSIKPNNSIAFNGYKPVKSDLGANEYEFNYPFDSDKFNCYLEICEVTTDDYGNFISGPIRERFDADNPELDGQTSYKLKPGPNRVNLKTEYLWDRNEPFAYHYKLEPKNGGIPTYKVDNGTIIDERNLDSDNKQWHKIYNIITPGGSKCTKGGAMKLFIPDTYKPGYIYDKNGKIKDVPEIRNAAKNAVRTVSNRLGGTLAGVEKGLDEGDFDSYNYLISTPIFTDALSKNDPNVSFPVEANVDGGAAYWNENCMQICHGLGSINNWVNLQKKLFAKGKNWISDGAFVNEGLNGVHFRHVLKWDVDSYAFNWFKAQGLKDGPLSASIFCKNHDFISHKIINSPYSYKQTYNGEVRISRNSEYDSKKPTIVQVFDNRLVDEADKRDTSKLITRYKKLNTDNPLDINNHNDTIINYPFVINPKTYNNNVKRLNEYNKSMPKEEQILMNTYMGTRFLTKFDKLNVEEKFESGFTTWDANPDIAKLNFVSSHADTQESFNIENPEDLSNYFNTIESKNTEVQDYIINSAQYWTKKTNQILNLHVAQTLKIAKDDKDNPGAVYNKIIANVDKGIYPKIIKRELNKEMIQNVMNGDYQLKPLSCEDFKTQLSAALMDIPLDTIELGNDISGVLAAPYISKKASHPDDIGKSRSELFKEHNPHLPEKYRPLYKRTEKMYLKDGAIYDFANSVLSMLNKELGTERSLITPSKDATTYGKYVLPHLSAEIIRYAVIKGLFPDTEVKINKEDGQLIYDYDKLKNTNLLDLKIHAGGPEEEASKLLSKIEHGVSHLKDDDKKFLKDALALMLKDTDANSFKLAELIVDKSGAGLDWRIDATKDIADLEALRNETTDFEYTWNNVIDFWSKFTKSVLNENPNAYMVAEITDQFDLFKQGAGFFSEKFSNLDNPYNKNNMDSIDMKTLRETKLTALANYTYLFTTIAEMFSKNFEFGTNTIGLADENLEPTVETIGRVLYDKFVKSGIFKNYLKSSPIESLIYSYLFIGNHDKPRALHCMAMDMGMFYTNLADPNNTKYRERAYRILNDDYFVPGTSQISDVSKKAADTDFGRISPKAIAMAESLRAGFIKAIDTLRDSSGKGFKDDMHPKAFEAISKSVMDLANGEFNDKIFESEGLGVKEFPVVIELVIKQMEQKYNFKLSKTDRKDLADTTYDKIIRPANSKLIGMQKYLAALIGNPTLYAGDDLGSTGYESATKNIYLQNRGYLHYEWADPNNKEEYKSFIGEGKKTIDKEMGIRANYENHALNDGAPYMLPLQHPKDSKLPITAIFRQSSDGAMAISVFNPTGMNRDHELEYKPQELCLEDITLTKPPRDPNNPKPDDFDDVGLQFGIQPDIRFMDTRTGDNNYYVRELDGKYMIKYNNQGGDYEKDSDIVIKDSTLVLTHCPSFTGRMNKILVSNPYKQSEQNITGSKLSLTAR